MTGVILIITNLLFVLLFARLFIRDDSRESMFNPIVLATDGVTNRIAGFVWPLFPRMKRRQVFLVTLVFLLLFRSAVLASVRSPELSVCVGASMLFSPKGGWQGALIFGFIEFFVFIVNFWGMELFISFISPYRAMTCVSQAIDVYARPVSLLPRWLRTIAIIAANALGAYMLMNFTNGALGVVPANAHPLHSAFDTSTAFKSAALYVGVTFFSICDVLLFVRQALFISIFASLFAAILQRRGLAMFFIEFQNTLLGVFSGRRLAVGMFDFAPVIFYIALEIIYDILIYAATMALKYVGVIAAGALAVQHF